MKWISVDDELPEETGHYLVVTEYEGYYNRNPMEFFFNKDTDWHWSNGPFGAWKSHQRNLIIYENHVTYWMPLPDPPK